MSIWSSLPPVATDVLTRIPYRDEYSGVADLPEDGVAQLWSLVDVATARSWHQCIRLSIDEWRHLNNWADAEVLLSLDEVRELILRLHAAVVYLTEGQP